MDTWDAIRARRNVRDYVDRPIEPSDLDRILDAGRRAPSSMNQQPWDFVAVTGAESLRRLADVWQYGGHIATAAAAVAFLAPASGDRETFAFDVGQAAMSMMLAAADLGIGSCHSAVGAQELARDQLGYGDDRECVIIVSFGYPSVPLAPIERPNRRAFDDVVHRERW